MTWSMPQSAAPLPPNRPTAPPGPLMLGDLFSSLFATYKAGWKLFLMLCLVPILLAFAAAVIIGFAVFAALAPVMGSILSSGRGFDPASVAVSLIGVSLLSIVVIFVVSLISYVYYCRIYIAAIDYATGREIPTWASLAARTQGLLGRLAQLVLIFAGVAIAVYFVLGFVVFGLLAASDGGRSGAPVFFIFVLLLGVFVGLLWVSVKLTYVLVVLAEERLSAMDAIRRTFTLTKGAFWRTFGYLFIIGLAIGLVTAIPQGMLSAGAQAAARGNSSGMALFGSLLLLVLTFALMPVQNIWLALMYVGRTREIANQAAGYTNPGYPGTGTSWGAPASPFGQTPDQYRDQQAPGYPAPSDPYGQPGAYGQPGPTNQPPSGQAGYGAPGTDAPYGQPDTGQQGGQPSTGGPYGQPGAEGPYGQPNTGNPYGTQPGSGTPYGQPGNGGPYGTQPGAPYGQPDANGSYTGGPAPTSPGGTPYPPNSSAPYGQSTPQAPYQPGPPSTGGQPPRPEDQPPSGDGYYGRPSD